MNNKDYEYTGDCSFTEQVWNYDDQTGMWEKYRGLLVSRYGIDLVFKDHRRFVGEEAGERVKNEMIKYMINDLTYLWENGPEDLGVEQTISEIMSEFAEE
jgi:hypothetical protein